MRPDVESASELLAPASPVQRFEPPDPAARELVGTVWTHVVPPGVSVLRVVPDAAIDIVFAADGLRVAGPDTGAVLESFPPGTRVVGFQLQPGAAESLLGVPATAVRDDRVDLRELWGAAGSDALEAMQGAPDARRAATVLDAEVARRRRAGGAADGLAGALVERLHVEHGAVTVGSLADDFGLSERQLSRRCTAAFGYGPKVLGRIMRLQSAVSLLRQGESFPLARVAADAGYSDQAHLTREVHSLTGLTPTAVRAQLEATGVGDGTAAA